MLLTSFLSSSLTFFYIPKQLNTISNTLLYLLTLTDKVPKNTNYIDKLINI